jgi:endonuclease/exonuclease/phosphatase family metal-dependent hydrolase
MPAPARLGALLVLLPALAAAADVPVGGRKLQLRANQTDPARRFATIVFRDAAIAPPFSDPTAGATLVVTTGAEAGGCRALIPLDPTGWTPIGGDGAGRGWRYRGPDANGIRRIALRAGFLAVSARGPAWPCDLAAPSHPLPVSVVLRTASRRYCAAFATAARNGLGRLVARNAPAPASCPVSDLTVANLNILHGIFCPAATASCRRLERIALLFQWITGSGCPDVVTLQEVWDPAVPEIEAHLATTCPFPYERVYFRVTGLDDEMILSRYPVLASESIRLYRNFRHVTFARVDHPIGPVDVFSTHLASGSDFANSPCTAPPAGDCPAACVAAGAATVRQCQGVQLADYVAARHDVPTPAVVTGDLNEPPGSFVYGQLTSRGWIDTHLAAGNPECDPSTGVGCTSGRDDESLDELESTASNQSARIDYVFLVPPGPGALCLPSLDPAADLDGDGSATRIFADVPNPFAPACGPAPDAICWPSDHEGAELDLECW